MKTATTTALTHLSNITDKATTALQRFRGALAKFPKAKVIQGPRGSIHLSPRFLPAPVTVKSKRENRKHNSAVRRERPGYPVAMPLWHGFTRRDGAKVIRVIGRPQLEAMQGRYYEAQMLGKVGGKRRNPK